MKLLYIYEKIQLKIDNAKQKIKASKDKTYFLKLFARAELVFWKIIRFLAKTFAVLFGDSSENFLIFTRLNKDSVFVCTNSFCQYKKMEKKVRFFSKTAFVLVLISTILTSSILYFLMPGKPSSRAATFNWVQTDWSGGADTVNFPSHLGDQTGWDKYYEKDANVDDATAGEIKLSQTSSSLTETSDADFNAGTKNDTAVSGTGDTADITLAVGGVTTTDSFTDTSKIASSSDINFDTENGQVKIGYYHPPFDCTGGTDHAGADWTPTNGSMVGGIHCNIGTFSIPSGYTIYTTAGDIFKVSANTISISGTLNANAKGYAGGAGGAGGVAPNDPGLNGLSGTNAGSYGGAGGVGGVGGNCGGWGGDGGDGGTSIGATYGDATSYSIEMGGGGSGGGGGGAGYYTGAYSGGAGASGQRGGGAMFLYANTISISGTITANGGSGGNGGNGGTGGGAYYLSSGGGGGGGSGGGGGGVLIDGANVIVSGTIMANGGIGGNGGGSAGNGPLGSPGNQGGGGRIKIFYETIDTSLATIAADGYNNGTVYTKLISSYLSLGTLISTNLLASQTVGPISSFSYNLTALPAGTAAQVSFSQDSTNWYNSSGTASGWDAMNAGNNTIDLSGLNWTGANFYYKIEFTSNGTDTPILDSVSIHTDYFSTGNYISSIKDTGVNGPSYLNISWSDSFLNYKKAVTLNNSGSALTDYQILITEDTTSLISQGKMRSDCGDIRFFDSNSNSLNYWIESGCNTSSTKIWVKVPSIPSGESVIYFAYDNSSAASQSDGDGVFDFFDDFEGTSLDTSKWTALTGDYSISNSEITITSTNRIDSINTYTGGYAMRVKAKPGTTDPTGLFVIGFVDPSHGLIYDQYYTTAVRYLDTNTYFQYVSGNGGSGQRSDYATPIDASYHIYEARRTGTADKFQLDSESELTGSYPTNQARIIRFFNWSADIISDWIFVRKYVASEPLASLGAEESANYLAGGTIIKFQISSSADNVTWTGFLGPDGTTSTYYTTSGTSIWSGHNGDRYIKYKAYLETTDTSVTQRLHDVTINFGITSTLTSSPYDASDSGQVISQISWTETAPTGTNVRFQIRTAPESSGTYTVWMGPDGTADTYFDESSSGCSKTGSDVTCDILNTLGISDGVDDRWMQYKVWLSSSVAETPVLQNVSVQYVVNATPVVSNVTASQGSDGIITASYDLSDEDSSSFTVSILADFGITLNEELTSSDATGITVSDSSLLPSSGTIQIDNEQISYTSNNTTTNTLEGTITRGANNTKALSHSSTTAVWARGSTVSGDVGASQTAGTGKSITWTIKSDFDGVYYAAAKIRVSANDGNAANQVGNGDSLAFVLDAKDPVLGTNPILIDASAGLSQAALTLDASDDTALEMKISNNSDLSADGANADSGTWISYASSKSWILETDPDTVYIQFKDSKGNTSAIQSATSLPTPEFFMIQDTSNMDAGEFREFVAWKASTISNFQDYIVESSTDNVTFSSLTTITNQALNYYTHASLIQDQDYYYRVYQEDTLGNKSPKTAVKHGMANGAQDFDEGGGGTAAGVDTTAPVITHDYATQVTNITSSTATITFTTDEMSDSYIGYSTDTSYANEQGVPTMIAAGEVHTVTLVGLSENTQYHYRVKSRDASGNVGTSQDDVNYVFTTATDTTPPSITFDHLSDIANITDSSAIISWTTDEAATSIVDYGTDISYGSSESNANYNIDHSITLTNLAPETTYYFKITSVDGSISANSSTDDNSGAGYTFTTLASSDSAPPVISAVNSGTPSYNTATITWTTDELSNSLVDFGTDINYGSTQGDSSDSTTSHSVVLAGLAPETTYYYRVKSMDASGNTAVDDNSGAGYTFTTAAAPDTGDTTPPVISNVSASSVTSTEATISWTTDESSDSTVGFSLDTSFNSEQGTATATTSHSITLINLAPDTTYYYQVKSRDSAGNLAVDDNGGAGYSFTTLAGGDALAPIISDVTVSDITSSTAKVTWTTNENSNSLVDYSGTLGVFTSTAGKYQDSATSHSVTLTGLDPSTSYYFQVRSADISGNEGKDSNGGSGYTFTTISGSDSTPPSISDVLAGTPTYNSVTITWTTDELSSSLVDFGTSTSYGTTQGNSADLVTSHSVTLTGLNPSTTYYYRVKSIDIAGNLVVDDNSGAGYTFTTAEGLDTGDTTSPVITFNSDSEITNVTSSSATISWTTDENADSTVGYSVDASFGNEKGSAALTTTHSVTLINLSQNTTYKFQIKSKDGSGNLAVENNSGAGYTFTTLAGGDSAKPIISNVAVGSVTDTTATITWTTDENSSSLVDYGTALGTFTASGGNSLDSVTSHSVTLSGLSASTTYYFRVRSSDANKNEAIDAGGTSGYSFTTEDSEPTTCPTISCGGGGGVSIDTNPPAISDVKVSEVTSSSAKIEWKTNEKGYSLVEYGDSENYGSIAGSHKENTESHTVSLIGLKPDTIYNYRVNSADSSGNLAQSDNFTFKTLSEEELTSEEKKHEKENHEKVAIEIQTKLEELIQEGMDEETVRNIISKATESPVIETAGPEVANITNNSAEIIWTTDRKSNSVVKFKIKEDGINPEDSIYLKQSGNFTELDTKHKVALTNLLSNATYQYQAQSSDILGNTGKSEWKEFTTLVVPSIYDVIVSDISLNSAVINWKTNVASTSKIEYGKTINYGLTAFDKENIKTAKHIIKLVGLESGTTYHFRVRGTDDKGNVIISDDYTFTTFTLPQIEKYSVEKVEDTRITIKWKTNVKTDSTIKYTYLNKNITKKQGEDTLSSLHEFILKGLNPGTEYLLQIHGRDIYGNEIVSDEFSVKTLQDLTPPKITQVKTETAISSGKSELVQTIISWKTDEPSTSQVLWGQGIKQGEDLPNHTAEDENYTTNHIVVITNFKPASVYQFRVKGKDRSGNVSQSKDFTILIPEKKKSVIQIIISNFENTFGWLKKLRR